MAVNEEILLDIKVQDADALENIGKLAENNKILKDTLKDLKKAYKDGEVSERDYAKQAAVINKQIKENNAGIRKNTKEIKTNAAQVASASDSINGMRARVADLNGEWNSLSASARESDVGKAIQREMKALNESINAASISVGNFKDNIGRYPGTMADVGLSNTKVGKTFDSLGITSASSMKSITSSVSGMVSKVNSAFLKLLANPVVLLVAGITAAFTALVFVFNKVLKTVKGNEEQSNRLRAALAPLSIIGDSITRVFERMGETLITVAEGFGSIVGAALDFLGVSKEVNQSSEDYIQLEKDKAKLAKDIRKNNEEISKQELEIAELRDKISQKDKYTAAERLEFIEQATAKELAIGEKNKKLKEENLRILEEENERTKSSAEYEEKLSQARIEVNNATRDALNNTRRLNAQKIEAINAIKAEIAAEKAKAKTLEENRKKEEEARKKEEERLAKENAEKIKREAKERAENLLKELQNEIELYNISNEAKKVGAEQTNKEIYESEIAAIKKNRADKLKALQIELEGGLISEKEFSDKKELLNAETNLAIAKNNADFEASERERKKEQQAVDFENELATLNENSERAIELKKQQLDIQMAAEIEAARKTGASTLLIEKKYANEKKKIDDAVFEAKMSQARSLTEGISELFGEATVAGKIAASASVAIDSYKGAASAISTMGSTPIGMAMGVAQAATIIANGVKTIAKINAVSEKKPTTISGVNVTQTSSSSGAISRASSLPTLSSMYGSTASQTETAQIIQSSQPRPVVSVTDISLMQKSVEVKENSKL